MIITNAVLMIVVLTMPVHLADEPHLKTRHFIQTVLLRKARLLYLPNSTTSHLPTLLPYPSVVVYTINQDTLLTSTAVMIVTLQSACMIWVVVGQMIS